MKITKESSIQEIFESHPESVDILIKYGFHCIGCALAQYETLEQGAKAHGLDKDDLKKMLEELNSVEGKSEKD